jgi:hypothetical protein
VKQREIPPSEKKAGLGDGLAEQTIHNKDLPFCSYVREAASIRIIHPAVFVSYGFEIG